MYNFGDLINLPYKNLGRDKSGVDCYGLVRLSFLTKKGIELPDFTELLYDKEWYKTKNHIVENIWNDFEEVIYPYKPFDCLLFYSIEFPNVVNHIGLYIEEGKFLHISSKYSSRISRLDDHWQSRLYKVLRYKRMINNAKSSI